MMPRKGLLLLLFLAVTSTAKSQESVTTPAAANSASSMTVDKKEESTADPEIRLQELTVTERRPTTAASSETIRARDYELRPHTTTQEILNNIPGLVVAQHQGGGKETDFYILGFDADHISDVAVFVDGLPVNMIIHADGQGY